jgi:flavin-dependent dehydrogenase
MIHDVVGVGGGLAGGAVAAHLARAGRDVLVLERTAGPHDKVCGEFLSYEAQEELQSLGLDLRSLGAVPIRGATVAHPFGRCATALPFEALSLSRRVLDEALLSRAGAAGAQVRRSVRATTLERTGEAWSVQVEGAGNLTAREVILATGKHDLRGRRRPVGRQSDLLAFKMYWTLAQPKALEGRVELHLFPDGYAGLQMVEGGRANLCLVVRQATFAAIGATWDALLAYILANSPVLAERLAGGVTSLVRPLAVSAIPYGHVQEQSDGVWRLGDQAAVIPSFTGDGMSIALHSARRAADSLSAGVDAESFQRHLASELRWQVRSSTMMSQALVTTWGQRAIVPWLTPSALRWALRRTRISESARFQGVAIQT